MADVLKPELVWVENRCYRFCDSSVWSQGKELQSYVEETYEPDCRSSDEESCDTLITIEPARGNRWMHSFHVNSNFYRFIIGAKGTTLKRLEADTKTIITIPSRGRSGDIVINGANQRDIISARNRIDLLIETSRSKLEFTHFISIPANLDEVKQNFLKFKEDILKNCGEGVREVSENIFQKPERLHLTIIMLVLLDDVDRKTACEALETCKNDIVIPVINKSGPIEIEFRGVEIMNDDPSEVDVLFIKVNDESGRLQQITDDIANYFINKGWARKQYDKVKLHLTAMNSKFAIDRAQRYIQKRVTFDASYILKEHENTFFGKAKLSTMNLSLRHSKSKDGYYQASATINFDS